METSWQYVEQLVYEEVQEPYMRTFGPGAPPDAARPLT